MRKADHIVFYSFSNVHIWFSYEYMNIQELIFFIRIENTLNTINYEDFAFFTNIQKLYLDKRKKHFLTQNL